MRSPNVARGAAPNHKSEPKVRAALRADAKKHTPDTVTANRLNTDSHRFARRGRRQCPRKVVRCINFFHSATARRAGRCRDRKNAAPRRHQRRVRRQNKIGDGAKSHISSAFLQHDENLRKNRADEIIFGAITAAPARRGVRAAPGGGAYTQN
jgi:hypothetical protein